MGSHATNKHTRPAGAHRQSLRETGTKRGFRGRPCSWEAPCNSGAACAPLERAPERPPAEHPAILPEARHALLPARLRRARAPRAALPTVLRAAPPPAKALDGGSRLAPSAIPRLGTAPNLKQITSDCCTKRPRQAAEHQGMRSVPPPAMDGMHFIAGYSTVGPEPSEHPSALCVCWRNRAVAASGRARDESRNAVELLVEDCAYPPHCEIRLEAVSSATWLLAEYPAMRGVPPHGHGPERTAARGFQPRLAPGIPRRAGYCGE